MIDIKQVRMAGGDIKPPCSPDCKDRNSSCHGTCERYIEYRKKNEKIKKKRHAESLRNQVKGTY